jgi:hypothetical protein
MSVAPSRLVLQCTVILRRAVLTADVIYDNEGLLQVELYAINCHPLLPLVTFIRIAL